LKYPTFLRDRAIILYFGKFDFSVEAPQKIVILKNKDSLRWASRDRTMATEKRNIKNY